MQRGGGAPLTVKDAPHHAEADDTHDVLVAAGQVAHRAEGHGEQERVAVEHFRDRDGIRRADAADVNARGVRGEGHVGHGALQVCVCVCVSCCVCVCACVWLCACM